MVSKKKKKKTWGKTKYFKQILSNKDTNHNGNDDQNREIRNTRIDHTKHGKLDVDVRDLGQDGQESGLSGLSGLSKLLVDIYDLSRYTRRSTKSEKK